MKLALWEARLAASQRNYDDAARRYLALFDTLSPEERRKYLDEFVSVLEEIGAAGGADYSKQIMLLLQSREFFPHEAIILNASAKFFFVTGRLLEALDFAQEAVTVSKGQQRVHALVNFENIKSNIMDQWHWAMLNDSNRNSAYATAIQLASLVRPNGRVLDIGTGTGLLTSIARRYFEREIYCCEVDQNMCDIAEKILQQRVIRKHSSDVTIDDVDNEQIDVVITETMDCGLLGEGIACTIYDVQKRILSPTPIIIPKCATVHACIIECPAISDEHVCFFSGRYFVSNSVTAPYTDAESRYNLEPYWCCSANEIRGGYKILSETVEIFTVNFDSRQELEKVVNDVSTELRKAPIICDGTAHSIMAWFSCELFPGAPSLNTSPESNSCWQQAFYPLPKPIVLYRGGICTLKVTTHKDQLFCALRDIIVPENVGSSGNAGPSSSSTDKNRASEELDVSKNWLRSNLPMKRIKRDGDTIDMILCYKDYVSLNAVTVLPNNDFTLMNDEQLLNFFKRSLADIQRKSAVHDQNVYVLDITNLSLLSVGLISTYPEMRFSCYNNDVIQALDFFTSATNSFATFPDGQDLMMAGGNSTDGYPVLSSKPPRTYFQDADFADVLLCWPISSHGFMIESTLNRVLSIRLSNKRVQIIPSKISIKGQLVSCPEIVHRSKPCPSAYQGVDLSAISDLAITFYYDIELSNLKYEIYSDPFELLSFRFDKPLPSDPKEMAEFICLTEFSSEVIANADGSADGLLFWFEAEHESYLYSAHSDKSLARCALFLFSESRDISKGDKLALKTSNYHGNVAIEVL